MDAVTNVHIDWMRDNRVIVDGNASIQVNTESDIGVVTTVNIGPTHWLTNVYSMTA